MARRGRGRQPSSYDGWAALGWAALALIAAGILGALALPGTTPAPFTEYAPGDFLRPEWLTLATLLAWPVYRAARASWWTALPVALTLSAESWYVVDTAVESMDAAGIGGSGAGWYVFAAVQAGIFLCSGMVGATRCLVRRRWLRQMRRLAPELAHVEILEPREQPAWEEGFSTG